MHPHFGVRRGGLAVLLAVISGLLYAASLPPLNGWPVAWIALTPLCVVVSWFDPLRSALLGLLTGCVAGVLTSPWLPAMVNDYFQVTGPLVWLATLSAWVLCGGIYFAIFSGWLAWAIARGIVSPLLVGAAWWLCEFARTHGLVPNPWALLGYSQMQWPLPAQIADLAGPYGIGAILAATAAWVAGAFVPTLRGVRPRIVALGLGAILVGQFAYGIEHFRDRRVPGAVLEVGLVQGGIAREDHFAEGRIAANLEQHLDLTREASRGGATLIAWPEFALDFYIETHTTLRDRLLDATDELGIELLAGGLGVTMKDGEPRRTNSVFLLRDNRIHGRYDKVRPMPFSEAAAFGGWFAAGPDPILAGEAPRLLPARAARIGVATCSEAMHPDYVRELVQAGAEVLLSPANDGWFGSRAAAMQQLRAVSMRAIEVRRFVLRPASSGYTAIIDPQGRVVRQAPRDQAAILRGSAYPARSMTPYARFGDATALLPLAFVGVDALARSRRRRAKEPAA